jgi:molecular chaperone GrpE
MAESDRRHGPSGPIDTEATAVLADDAFRADLAGLEQTIKALEAKVAENHNLYVRALAEQENLRKRTARDVEQAHRYGVERLAQDLLPVLDGFEQALANAGASDAAALVAGQAATARLLAKALEKAGIQELSPAGQLFNPEQQEAMATRVAADRPANTVLETVQKGYVLNGRVLRPARVIVSRQA